MYICNLCQGEFKPYFKVCKLSTAGWCGRYPYYSPKVLSDELHARLLGDSEDVTYKQSSPLIAVINRCHPDLYFNLILMASSLSISLDFILNESKQRDDEIHALFANKLGTSVDASMVILYLCM